jgi:chromosome segregation ATPase
MTIIVAVLLLSLGFIGIYIYRKESHANRRQLARLSHNIASLGVSVKQLQEAQAVRLPNQAIVGVDNLNAQLNRADWQLRSAVQQYEDLRRAHQIEAQQRELQFESLEKEIKAAVYFVEGAKSTSRSVRAGEVADPVSNWPRSVKEVAVSHDHPVEVGQ